MDLLAELRREPQTLPEGRYAIWFPCSEEPFYEPSKTRRNLQRLYAAAGKVSSYLYAALRHRIERDGRPDPPNQDVPRTPLPRELTITHVQGADEQAFVLSASVEKGVRFHFHQQTPASYRNAVLENCCQISEAMDRLYKVAGYPLDDESQSARQWWETCDRFAAELEKSQGKPLEALGELVTGDSAVEPMPAQPARRPWWKLW